MIVLHLFKNLRKIFGIAACIRLGNSRYIHFDNSFNLPLLIINFLDDLKDFGGSMFWGIALQKKLFIEIFFAENCFLVRRMGRDRGGIISL